MNVLNAFSEYYTTMKQDYERYKENANTKYLRMERVLNGDNNINFGLASKSLSCIGGITIGGGKVQELLECKKIDENMKCNFNGNMEIVFYKNDKSMSIFIDGKLFLEKKSIPKYKSIGVSCDKNTPFMQLDTFLSS
jgi:hypothetical protein